MMESGIIEIAGYKLRYQIEGQGPNTLVVGNALYYSRSFSQELRQHLRLIFVDWRGFAEAGPEAEPELTLEDILDDVEAVRQKLGLEACIVMGHSAHGLLALEYAKKYPEAVSHVVVIAITPNLGPQMAELAERNWIEAVWPERKAALAASMQKFPDEELKKLSPGERFVRWGIRRAAQTWYDYHFDSSPLWEGIKPNMQLLDYFYGVALRDLDVGRGLEQLKKPVLLALGRFDYIMAPPSVWDVIRPKFHELTLRIFEHSGHSPHYEEPNHFNKVLLDWLSAKVLNIANGR